MLICEEPPAGVSSASKNSLAELFGIVKLTALEWKQSRPNFRFYAVNVVHLKMFATGSGGGGKDPLVEPTELAFPGVCANNDERDALWLAEIGAVVAKVSIAQTPAQLYVAAVVRGDPDAAAMKADMDKEKGKRDRAAKKSAKGVADVLAHHA